MSPRRLTTWGRFNLNDVCGMIVCRQPPDDAEASRRFSQALELLQSCGMDFVIAVPEETRRPWWRRNDRRRSEP